MPSKKTPAKRQSRLRKDVSLPMFTKPLGRALRFVFRRVFYLLGRLLTLIGKILWVVLFPLRPVLRPIGRYLVGVRDEFRQVKWSSRRETWKLTFAVVIFSFALVIVVQLLDYGYRQLFEKVII